MSIRVFMSIVTLTAMIALIHTVQSNDAMTKCQEKYSFDVCYKTLH